MKTAVTPEKRITAQSMQDRVNADRRALRLSGLVQRLGDIQDIYIVILSEAGHLIQGDYPLKFYPHEEVSPIFTYIAELEKEKFIEVIQNGKDARGEFIAIEFITYKGRIELARLKYEKSIKSWHYKFKDKLWSVICFILGALVSSVMPFLVKLLEKSLSD